MKTRIIYTKIWEDDFFSALSLSQKALFMYFITNPRIGQTGIYEISDRIITFETGATNAQLNEVKDIFTKANKVLFRDGWVKVVNTNKYNTYTGDNNDKARIKEEEGIPNVVISSFDTPPEGVDTPSIPVEGTTNHNKKSLSVIGVVKGIDSVTPDEIERIASDYKVPIPFVQLELEKMSNYLGATGKKYKDYSKALRNWVLRDAQKQVEGRNYDERKRGIDASQI